MYAVKPWGRAYVVGSTVGSLALAIGMRQRETDVTVVERRASPHYEATDAWRRCVVPAAALRVLRDIGCSDALLARHLAPARGWRFVAAADLSPLRDGARFDGAAPAEPVFHAREGALLRLLRGELLRFGGAVDWGAEAFDAAEDVVPQLSSNFGAAVGAAGGSAPTWTLFKRYGPATGAEAIVSFARGAEALRARVLAPDPEALGVLFDVRRGVCRQPPAELLALFGPARDVVVAVGRGVAVHLWCTADAFSAAPDAPVVSWRCVSKGRSDAAALVGGLHPLLAALVAGAPVEPELLPATTPAVRDDAASARLGLLGAALLPIDPFEWRGDFAARDIDEAAAALTALYGGQRRFHRSHAPTLLRGLEQDALARRAALLRRDLLDAEHFLAVHPQLPPHDDPNAQPLPHRIAN